jgi:hypothetical protein
MHFHLVVLGQMCWNKLANPSIFAKCPAMLYVMLVGLKMKMVIKH